MWTWPCCPCRWIYCSDHRPNPYKSAASQPFLPEETIQLHDFGPSMSSKSAHKFLARQWGVAVVTDKFRRIHGARSLFDLQARNQRGPCFLCYHSSAGSFGEGFWGHTGVFSQNQSHFGLARETLWTVSGAELQLNALVELPVVFLLNQIMVSAPVFCARILPKLLYIWSRKGRRLPDVRSYKEDCLPWLHSTAQVSSGSTHSATVEMLCAAKTKLMRISSPVTQISTRSRQCWYWGWKNSDKISLCKMAPLVENNVLCGNGGRNDSSHV